MHAPPTRGETRVQSFTIAITMPASTNTTITTWVHSQIGDIAVRRRRFPSHPWTER